ncbi:MAG: hypothetical protein ACOC4B_00495, partial [Bacteroidota bacterium]
EGGQQAEDNFDFFNNIGNDEGPEPEQTIDISEDIIEKNKKLVVTLEDRAAALNNVNSITQNLIQSTQALKDGESNWASFAGSVLTSVASLIPQLSTLFSLQSATSLGANIPGAIGAVGAALALVGSLQQSTKKFASGGIAGGLSVINDRFSSQGEIVDLPNGTRVYSGRQSDNIVKNINEPQQITFIPSLRFEGTDFVFEFKRSQTQINRN